MEPLNKPGIKTTEFWTFAGVSGALLALFDRATAVAPRVGVPHGGRQHLSEACGRTRRKRGQLTTLFSLTRCSARARIS